MSLRRFDALGTVPGLVHGFLGRVPEVRVESLEKAEAVQRLWPHWEAELLGLGVPRENLWTAEQVHGGEVAVVPTTPDRGSATRELAGVDGLLTGVEGQFLGILVADCCAVFLIDRENRACGLVHSGKRGTELRIVPRAFAMMVERFGSRPDGLQVVLSPCIRPPHYENDFAAEIRRQCEEAGIPPGHVIDERICTFRDQERYYSYRREKGKTGRMLAVVGFA